MGLEKLGYFVHIMSIFDSTNILEFRFITSRDTSRLVLLNYEVSILVNTLSEEMELYSLKFAQNPRK